MKKNTLGNYQTPYEEMLDAVIEARGNNPTVIPQHEIHFTPGVPTEDGWYVVRRADDFYDTALIRDGKRVIWTMTGTILSHAKLPEL